MKDLARPEKKAPRTEPQYALALAYALPFFLGMAILWIFLKLDIDRQYAQTTRDIDFRLRILADSAGRDLRANISVIDDLLLSVRGSLRWDEAAAVDLFERRWRLIEKSATTSASLVLMAPDGAISHKIGALPLPQSLVDVIKKSNAIHRGDDLRIDPVLTAPGGAPQLVFSRPTVPGAATAGRILLIVSADMFSLRPRGELFNNRDYLISITDPAGVLLWRDADRNDSSAQAWLGLKEKPNAVDPSGLSPSSRRELAGLEILQYRSAVDAVERLYAAKVVHPYPIQVLVGIRSDQAYASHYLFRGRYVVLAVLVSTLLIVSLYWFFTYRNTVDRAKRRQLADMELLEQRQAELLASRQQLRELATHQMSLKEIERKRIALEIHDELGQRVTALRLELGLLERKLKKDGTPAMVRSITEFKKQIDAILDIVRNVATRLRPAILDLGLTAALMEHLKEFRKKTRINATLQSDLPDDFKMSEEQTIGIFRIFQESLTNIARHSEANQVSIFLSTDGAQFRMLIHDNGVGLPPPTLGTNSGSLGLSGMRERAIALGGECEITSDLTGGVKVQVVIPFSPHLIIDSPSSYDLLSPIRSE